MKISTLLNISAKFLTRIVCGNSPFKEGDTTFSIKYNKPGFMKNVRETVKKIFSVIHHREFIPGYRKDIFLQPVLLCRSSIKKLPEQTRFSINDVAENAASFACVAPAINHTEKMSFMKKGLYNSKILSIVLIVTSLLFVQKGYSQITQLSAWSNQFHTASNTPAGVTYTIPTGSHSSRILVVAIASTTNAASTRTVTLTYGNQTLTAAAGDMGVSQVQHTELYYLNESGIEAATNSTLSFSITGGATVINNVWAAVFDGVNQSSPIDNSQTTNNFNNTTGIIAFTSPGLSINSNEQAVEVVSSVHTSSTTIHTITAATNWTSQNSQTWTTTYGINDIVANRSIPASATTDVSSTSTSGAGTGTTVGSMTAISLAACTPPSAPTVTSPINYCQGATASQLTATGTGLLWYTSATGGTGSSTAPTPSTASAGSTTYYVSQTIGCESPRASITVVVNSTPSTSVNGSTNVTCYGGADGTITIAVTGGTAPFSFSVDNGVTYPQTSSTSPYTFIGLQANTPYQIRVKDSNGCISQAAQ